MAHCFRRIHEDLVYGSNAGWRERGEYGSLLFSNPLEDVLYLFHHHLIEVKRCIIC